MLYLSAFAKNIKINNHKSAPTFQVATGTTRILHKKRMLTVIIRFRLFQTQRLWSSPRGI
jgi:hypothetical protein